MRGDRAADRGARGARRSWQRADAVVELVRGRLQGLGPVTIAVVATQLGLPPGEIEAAMLSLENEGFVLRGRFTAEAVAAPSDLTTLEVVRTPPAGPYPPLHDKTLRAEIEPVATAEYMRILLEWQGVTSDPRPEGVESLAAVIEQLEGYEVPAAAWKRTCSRRGSTTTTRTGSTASASRVGRSGRGSRPPRADDRRSGAHHADRARDAPQLAAVALARRCTARGGPALASALARAATPRAAGASFFDDIVSGSRLLRSQAESALAELVAAGLVNSDSYSGLRALLIPSDRKRQLAARRRRVALFGLEDAGRWSLIRKGATSATDEAIEQVADLLLRRYGVVFRRVLEREADGCRRGTRCCACIGVSRRRAGFAADASSAA